MTPSLLEGRILSNVQNYSCVVFSGHSHTLKPNNRIKSKERKSSTPRPELIYSPNDRPPRAHWILFVVKGTILFLGIVLHHSQQD